MQKTKYEKHRLFKRSIKKNNKKCIFFNQNSRKASLIQILLHFLVSLLHLHLFRPSFLPPSLPPEPFMLPL